MHRWIEEWDEPRIDSLRNETLSVVESNCPYKGSSLKEGGEGEEGKTDYNIF
jgi:hypothetical protein